MTMSLPRPARLALAALLAAAAPIAASAQKRPADAPPADTAALHAELRAILPRLFDGMRARDTAAMRALLHPGATLHSAGERDGVPVVAATPITQWFAGVAQAPAGTRLDERLLAQELRVDGGLATIWADYEFWVGDRFSHCGVDAVTVGRTAAGWRILAITDTRRRTGCRAAPSP